MRSLAVIIMHELFNSLACTCPTAHPRVMETVDAHFEGVKPLFDEVSIGIVNPTVQPQSSKGSPIPKLIDEKHRFGEIVFLAESMQERSRRIGAVASEQPTVENQLRVKIYRSVQLKPLAVYLDSGLVKSDS